MVDLEKVSKILDTECFRLIDIAKYNIIFMDGAVSESNLAKANGRCFSCWLQLIKTRRESCVDVNAAFRAGVQMLSRLNGPFRWRFKNIHVQNRVPKELALSLRTNLTIPSTITSTRLSCISAFLENAR